MTLHQELHGFDISELVSQYENHLLEEIFPNFRIRNNSMGEFMELFWDLKELSININLNKSKRNLLNNLKTVCYLGKNMETYFNNRGIRTLQDLKFNLRFSNLANDILTLIKNKDYNALRANKHVNDVDLSFCFDIEDLLFLDIETLGICDSPMIILGLGFFENGIFKIRIYLARKLEEEIAMCEHFKNEILPRFKSFVTYNGKSFDIPFIVSRFLYYFDENPLISEGDLPYEDVNTLYHHIDLYHGCRRKFKGMFNDFTLTTIEKELLGWKRENELPSNLVGVCYRKYLKEPRRYVGLMKEAIEHNYYDIYSMPLIYRKLL